MEIELSPCDDSDRGLSDLDYADSHGVLTEGRSKLRLFFDDLNSYAGVLQYHFLWEVQNVVSVMHGFQPEPVSSRWRIGWDEQI